MCNKNLIKCSVVITLIIYAAHSAEIKNAKLLYSEQEIVDALVKKWSPLVWLAPNERFMPGNVKTFLSHVHAEREKPSNKKIKDIGDNLGKYSHYYQNDGFEDLVYYEPSKKSTISASSVISSMQNNRKRRNFDKETSLEYIFELPIDDASENWYLVTNDDLDDLMKNDTSFIYGENPSQVPIYAVVSMCSNTEDFNLRNEIESNIAKFQYKKNPYIPLIKSPEVYKFENVQPIYKDPSSEIIKSSNDDKKKMKKKFDIMKIIRRKRRQLNETAAPHLMKVNETSQAKLENLISSSAANSNDSDWKAILSPNKVIIYTKDNQIMIPSQSQASINEDTKMVNEKLLMPDIPHFHVDYWMFYPFSQGKTICTLNLGPLGPFPIPLFFNICLGTRKEFGSHVGDWEHMSLHFKGRMEPEEMYVSAHDAGAYYTFDKLTGTFEFKSQETRKGILQQPNFPKTVITSDNHPVLFSAEGSHGLWATPGKHRFVRVPRLYDINGFGIPWQTWNNVEVIHNEARGKRSMGGGGGNNPNWMKYRGKWGNPKTKCHPLKRIGLHVCELTDGPTGIPKKVSHFQCSR